MASQKRKRLKTSISIDPDLWADFKVESARERIEPSEAVERLLERYLRTKYSAGSEKAPASRPTYSPAELHALLDEVLQDGTLHVDAIAANLELLAFAVRFVGSHSFEEIRSLRKRLSAASKQANQSDKKKK